MNIKQPEKYPSGRRANWWRSHPLIYHTALRSARDARLRSLAMLGTLVKRQMPVADAIEEIKGGVKWSEEPQEDWTDEADFINPVSGDAH